MTQSYDNKQIVAAIKNQDLEKESKDERSDLEEYIEFSVADDTYALPTAQVKEIVFSETIHFLPFCPPYITGLLSYRGLAVAVLDLQLLQGKAPCESDKFLILEMEEDRLALLVSDLVHVESFSEKDFVKIGKQSSDFSEASKVIQRMVLREKNAKNKKIYIVDAALLYEKLLSDVKADVRG